VPAAPAAAASDQPAAAPKTLSAEARPAAPPAATIPKAEPYIPAKGAELPAEPIAKSLRAPDFPQGSTVWQVAAVTPEMECTTMAQALQQKKFPAFVLVPTSDKFYHVQVGPYTDDKSVKEARQKLENQGFKNPLKIRH